MPTQHVAATTISAAQSDPLVSIIMPVYGVEEFLDLCVGSVVAQTHHNLEIILIDDGSPDDCPRMCDEWAKKDSRISVIHTENGGLSAARNTGLKAATGDYIYFLDPDDMIEPRLVQTCLGAMSDNDADLVMFRFDTISASGDSLESSYKHNDYDETVVLEPEEAIKMQLQSEINGYFWAFLAPARTYRKQHFSFPEGRVIEDLARICNIIGESTHVVRIPDVLYHYRLRGGSVLGTFSPSMFGDWIEATQDREEYIEAHYPQLRSFMLLNSLNIFSNVDLETVQQTLVYGLKLDPESQKSLKASFDRYLDELKEMSIPKKTKQLLDALRDKIGGDDGDDDGDAEGHDKAVAHR